jgi:hypothetical protein
MALPPNALVIAEGDSWFDYPPREFYPDDKAYEADRRDVLKCLKDMTVHNEPGGQSAYTVESVAAASDRVEDMAYGGPEFPQLAELQRLIGRRDPDRPTPTAVLLSGGGMDLVAVDGGGDPAGTAFGMLLNHARSASVLAGQNELNESVVTGVIDQRLRDAYVTMLRKVTEFSVHSHGQPLPILMHGYAYPVPDGRPTPGGLGSAFVAKGYGEVEVDANSNPPAHLNAEQRERLQVRIAVMKQLIDRFNAMLEDVADLGEFAHVRYVNLRDLLSTELQGNNFYQKWWENELHPTKLGFRAIAKRFHEELQRLG